MEFANASFDDDTVKKKIILNLCNFFKNLQLFFWTLFPIFEILWQELMSHFSYIFTIDYLLLSSIHHSMLDKLAEAIFNGGAPIAFWFCEYLFCS